MATQHTAAFLALLAFASCGTTPPRTSTEQERTFALDWLTNIETAVTTATVLGKIPPSDLALALKQIADLRVEVAATEFETVSWSKVLQRVANLAVAWAVERPANESNP